MPPVLKRNPNGSFLSFRGALAEWLCSGLQIRGPRFDSGTRLHINATLAQLVERNLAKVEVTSSNLVCRSRLRSPDIMSGLCFFYFLVTKEKTPSRRLISIHHECAERSSQASFVCNKLLSLPKSLPIYSSATGSFSHTDSFIR